jgi:hypothetical protein
VLRDPGCLRALCEAVAGADRLVLLGDVLELRERPLRDVLDDARPALAAIGAAARERGGAPAEIVLLAGNHDHRLVEPWLRRRDRATPLGLAAEVAAAPGDPLTAVLGALAGDGEPAHGGASEPAPRVGEPAPGGDRAPRVGARYPGTWVGPELWATHGHHVDRHTTLPILERLGAAVTARLTGSRDPRSPEDYEAALAPVYAWVDALAEHSRAPRDRAGSEAAWLALSGRGGSARRRALRAAFPVAIAALNRAGLGPLRADLSGAALRRAPLAAIGEVLERLGVGARRVVFGHTHRAGPLPGDDPAEWETPGGALLMNTGCWVRERGLLGADPAHSPYRPGWAGWVEDDPAAAPELVNLLD